MRAPLTWVPLVCLLLLPRATYADAISVNVLSSTYSTSLFVFNHDNSPPTDVTAARSRVATSPIHDALEVECFSTVCQDRADLGQHPMSARADAEAFSVTAFTSALDFTASATATATTVLEFAPVTDGIASLGLLFGGWDLAWFSWGSISLTDVTSSSQIWSFDWSRNFVGNIPWDHSTYTPDLPYNYLAQLNLSQLLSADHVYKLSMTVRTNGATDSEGATIQVTGLRSTPEPSTLALLLTSALGVGLRKMRQRRARPAA